MAAPDMPAITAMEVPTRPPASRRRGWFRLLVFGPAVIFFAIGLAFLIGLNRDLNTLPSMLMGKPVPDFSLPPVKGRTLGLATNDLQGEVSLLNVFASWCVACREEHPVFMRLKAQGTVPIHGLNYKDKPDDAARWLDEMGDPYTRTGADLNGRVAIDWGVYGVPETFVVDRQGHIVFKQVGAVTPQVLETTILPLVSRLQAGAPTASDPNRE